MPNYEEYKRGLDNLSLSENKVDYIITHTCSMSKFYEMSKTFEMFHKAADQEKPLRVFLDSVADITEYDKWFCGHFHIEEVFGKVNFLYESIKS